MSDTVVLERLSAPARRNLVAKANLQRQRVYILPSRQGIIFGFLLLTMLLGAINYNNSMAYLLTFLLASLLMVCLLHTWRNLAGLMISTEPARPVFAGEVARFPLLFDNRLAGEKPSIETGPRQAFRLTGKNKNPGYTDLLHIRANQLSRHLYSVKTQHRGVITPGRITISSRYPLGLFYAWATVPNNRRCLVYPRPAGKLPLPEAVMPDPRGAGGGKTGADDFIGFRHYRPGDSVRNIAWKALSREQPLLVKRFSGEKGTNLALSWQQVSSLGQTEEKLSQLCLWILQAEAAGYNYGLEIPGTRIGPGQGEHHQHACLEALAGFGMDHG